MGDGIPLLIEHIEEEVDPVLDPVLNKLIIRTGRTCKINLPDKEGCDYNDKFRLYFTTKLSNPHYSPEVCVKVNLLNFVATQEGLEDQMLGITVKRETPELEAQREQLVIEDAENKRVLKEIEDSPSSNEQQ